MKDCWDHSTVPDLSRDGRQVAEVQWEISQILNRDLDDDESFPV